MTKLISIITPCYNEEENIDELVSRIKQTMAALPYDYEHICIDNYSTDRTIEKIRSIAAQDSHVKLICNARNFGYIRSSFHAILQANGDACVLIAADLQDPPEIIIEFIKKWETGYKTVMAVKPESEESKVFFFLRKLYYRFISSISEIQLISNATGSGLYDRCVIEELRKINDPYPYFRGLVCEIGYPIATVPFKQPRRQRGVTKNNFYVLYDFAMLGITSHSKIPLRLMTIMGFSLSLLSLIVALGYLIAKLTFWNSFGLGLAPIIIGMFFFASIQMFSIGILGEYVGMIYTQIRKLPHVVETERVNFSNENLKKQ